MPPCSDSGNQSVWTTIVEGQTSASETPVAVAAAAVVSEDAESLLPQALRINNEVAMAIAVPIVVFLLLIKLCSPLSL
jgi:hypothetical protein